MSDTDPIVERDPEFVADLRPFIRRLRAAETNLVRLRRQVDLAEVEVGAARQEFDDAVMKVFDARGNV